MKRYLFFPCILIITMSIISSCSASSGQTQEAVSDIRRDLAPLVSGTDMAELVRGNSGFAFALYERLATGDANLFYSPYSISIALAMTNAGARNRTAEEMAQALHFTLPQERLHPAFNKLALELASRSAAEGVKPDPAFQLSIANSLWGQINYPFEADFLDLLARNYGAGMELADFAADPEAARAKINDWVSRETKEKVNDIVPAGVIKALTRLVLANAVYFKAAWQNPFPEDATRPGEFLLLNGTSVVASMMYVQADLRTAGGTGFRVVELPYAGGQVSMLVLLPDQGKFGDVEKGLDAGILEKTLAGLRPSPVLLSFPKFKFEWEAQDLPERFKDLGMRDAFSMDADFSGMTGNTELFIAAILHKAFVGVDEAGTEAAAATVVVMERKGVPSAPVVFDVDRPFLFLIRDNPTGTILFLGRVMNPTA